jgi:16S rRNA (guanine966-N2)-methyltransferase
LEPGKGSLAKGEMSTPRVIAGKARGMHLQDVPGEITRPITDRVKEALFNIIGADIQDASLLDLFGGTGSVGIEALSRGASFVRFIDIHRSAVATIRANLDHTHLFDKSEVIQADAFHYLPSTPNRAFDYIYIAPPQYKGLWLRTLQAVDNNPSWCSDGGWVIVQIDPVEIEPISFSNLRELEQRRYGSTLLIFLEKVGPLPEVNS